MAAHLTLHVAQHEVATHVGHHGLPHFLILPPQWWPLEKCLINALRSQHLAQHILSHLHTCLAHILNLSLSANLFLICRAPQTVIIPDAPALLINHHQGPMVSCHQRAQEDFVLALHLMPQGLQTALMVHPSLLMHQALKKLWEEHGDAIH